MQVILSDSFAEKYYSPGIIEQMKTKQGWTRGGLTYYHESVWTKSTSSSESVS